MAGFGRAGSWWSSTNDAGFTLVELLVVISIIGVLAAVGVQKYGEYRKRAYEATAVSYMRSWIPAQELYRQQYGRYADADEQLAEVRLGVLKVPDDVPYVFSIDSGSSATSSWWGTARPTVTGLHYFYIDQSGQLLSSLGGPPSP